MAKMQTICVRLPRDEAQRIKDLADDRGETLSDYFRAALRAREEKATLATLAKSLEMLGRDGKYLRVFLEELTKRMFKDAAKGEEVLKETLRTTLEKVTTERRKS